jgi:hypothetical protein
MALTHVNPVAGARIERRGLTPAAWAWIVGITILCVAVFIAWVTLRPAPAAIQHPQPSDTGALAPGMPTNAPPAGPRSENAR